MSTISVYFIPTKKYPVGQFKPDILSVLKKLKIVDGYYDEDDESYAHGMSVKFEYALIHDTDKDKLVPESSTTGYGATCIQCDANIDEEFYDTINDYYDFEDDSGKEKDMKGLSLTCNECSKSMKLQDIKFTQHVMFTNHFFQFVDIEYEISNELIEKIEQNLGTTLTVIYERM